MKKAHKFQIVKKSDKMKQNISQTTDSGRSMVEMLGVLAVIGVLSVASILGYRFAMAKWRANETVNELNIRAYDIATRFDKLVASNTREIEMEMGNTTKLGYPIMARISPQYVDYFEMFVSNVPTDVCKELLNSQWQAPYSIFVGVEEYEASSDICEQAENVQLAYEFYKDLSTRDDVPEEIQHKTQRCDHDNNCRCGTCNTEHGLCETWCEPGEVCLQNYSNLQKLKCCTREKAVNKLCCSNETSDGTCCNEGLNCCPVDKLLRDNDGNCYTCDEPQIITVSNNPSMCSLCPNRILVSNKYCAMPCGVAGTVNANKPVMDTEGKCHACDEANGFKVKNAADCTNCGRYIVNNTNMCVNCGVAGFVNAAKKLVDRFGICYSCDTTQTIDDWALNTDYFGNKICPDRTQNGQYSYPACPETKPLRDSDGICHDCYYEKSIPTTAVSGVCSEVCKKIRETTGDSCILTKCPDEKPVMDKNGSCHACTESNGFTVKNVADCTKCGRYIVNNNNMCVNCGVAGSVNAAKKLVDRFGICYSCDTTQTIDDWALNTDYFGNKICPDRTQNGQYSYPACPETKPLRDSDGICHDCYYEKSIPTTAVSGVCSEVCKKIRETKDDSCVLIKCPDEKPVMDKNDSCHACTESNGFNVKNVADCTKCGRYIVNNNNMCVNCGVAGSVNAAKKLVDRFGICYSCDTTQTIDDWALNANYFGDKICPNRTQNGQYSYRRECSADNRLLGTDNNCYPCYTPTPIDVGGKKERCDVCLGRYMQGDYCMPEPS